MNEMTNVRRRSTIFDDVFRTICQKMPVLLIAVINEVFGTDYLDDERILQLRNDYIEKRSKLVTDAVIQIDTALYHVECQSREDGMMVVRMIEYDFAIALEEAMAEGKPYRMRFPNSCVIYIRGSQGDHDLHMEVELPDGKVFEYSTKAVNVQSYSEGEIFKKKLLMFLPYYILRYEGNIPTARKQDRDRLEALLAEYDDICKKLEAVLDEMGRSELYTDLIKLIERISNYVIRSKEVREEVGIVMGGRILELQSEKDRRIGRQEGGNHMVYVMVQDGDVTPEKGASRLGITVDQLKANMMNTGYVFPEI